MARKAASKSAANTQPTTLKRYGKRKPVKANTRKTPSKLGQLFAKAFALVPIRVETVERAITASTVLLIVGAVVAAAWFVGIPGYVGTQVAEAAGRAGFKVRKVEIVGNQRMQSLQLYPIVLKEESRAMPLVDLSRIRTELMQYSWIEDARVSRRLPDTLVVDIVERKPAAIWQSRQKLSLVDEKGVVLEAVDPQAMPDLPLVVGDRANSQIASLNELMEKVPAIKKSINSATWIGNRRWDLQFKSGETLSLPEGEDMAAIALGKFNKMVSTDHLLGRGFARFDMRDLKQMYVRVKRDGSGAGAEKTSEDKTENAAEKQDKKQL